MTLIALGWVDMCKALLYVLRSSHAAAYDLKMVAAHFVSSLYRLTLMH